MRRILFCLAVLVLSILAQPASAQQSRKADLKPAQGVELSVFLASLSGKTVVSNAEEPNYCPPNYCTELKQDCAAGCAPCGWAATCYYYVCDAACYCYC
jgi:hypothetical protein